ncbi:hypothetical protein ACRBEV_01790 [Methylobacterium phyllosphaerae]
MMVFMEHLGFEWMASSYDGDNHGKYWRSMVFRVPADHSVPHNKIESLLLERFGATVAVRTRRYW